MERPVGNITTQQKNVSFWAIKCMGVVMIQKEEKLRRLGCDPRVQLQCSRSQRIEMMGTVAILKLMLKVRSWK